ncbi:MAG: hypothetical protein LBR44_07825 [Clostridiales Family XIII bacterium]|nr:hypothetical protein [Clostridiales Family XIII bacterium]
MRKVLSVLFAAILAATLLLMTGCLPRMQGSGGQSEPVELQTLTIANGWEIPYEYAGEDWDIFLGEEFDYSLPIYHVKSHAELAVLVYDRFMAGEPDFYVMDDTFESFESSGSKDEFIGIGLSLSTAASEMALMPMQIYSVPLQDSGCSVTFPEEDSSRPIFAAHLRVMEQTDFAAAQALASEIVATLPMGESDMDKAQAIHDFIISTCIYEWDIRDDAIFWPEYDMDKDTGQLTLEAKAQEAYNIGSAYSVFADKRGFCTSYAAAFKLMADAAGLPCLMVMGIAAQAHVWNLVYADGQWYQMDVTWDEPAKYGTFDVNSDYDTDDGSVLYDYFMVPVSDGYWEDHNCYPNSMDTYVEIGNAVYGLSA